MHINEREVGNAGLHHGSNPQKSIIYPESGIVIDDTFRDFQPLITAQVFGGYVLGFTYDSTIWDRPLGFCYGKGAS